MNNQNSKVSVTINKQGNKVSMDIEAYKLMINSIKSKDKYNPETLNSYCCIVCKDGELLSVANVNKETQGEALVECDLICKDLGGDRFSVATTPCADVDDPASTCRD